MRSLPSSVVRVVTDQDGVVARSQLAGTGATPSQVRSWLRHRLLTPVHPGVYLGHSGEPTPSQLHWAAILYCAPAALCSTSALLAFEHRLRLPPETRVRVAIDARRRLTAPPSGIDVHRVVGLAARTHPTASPPRVRVEEAVLDAAAEATRESDAVALLAQVVSARLTTPARVLDALRRRARLRRRGLLTAVLLDLEQGACSVLERAYLRDVERAHGLPTAARQVRASLRGTLWRDVEYVAQGVVVELDGRLDHTDVADRSRDLDRDLDAAVTGRTTLRLGHAQVAGGACGTAARVASVLQARGWQGQPTPCARC